MKMYRKMTQTLTVITAAMLMVAATVRADVSEILNQASADGHVVVVVPSLAQLSQDVAMLNGALGLNLDELSDVLGEMKRETGMTVGLRDQGGMLLVLHNVSQAITDETEPDVLMVLPVGDYDAFVTNLQGQPGQAVAAINMPGGHEGFAKKLGSYAVVSEKQEVLENYTAGNRGADILKQLGDTGQRYLNDADAAVYVDIEALAPALLPKIDEAMQKAMMQIEGQADDAEVAMAQNIARIYADATRTVLQSATAGFIAMDLTETGVGMSKVFRYKADSRMAALLPGGESQASAALGHLPNQPYIFAMSFDTQALAFKQIFDSITAAIPENQNNPALQLYRDAMPLIEQTRTAASVFYAPTMQNMQAGKMFSGVNIYRTADAATFVAANKQYLAKLNGQSMPAGPPQADGQQSKLTFTTSYTDNAIQVDGVAVDQYQMQMQLPPELVSQMGQLGPLMMMGGSGYTGYIASQGDHVIMTTIPDPQLVKAALEATKNNSGIGTTGSIAEMRELAMPPNPVMEGYLSVHGMASTANLYIGMMGGPQIQVPAELPAVSMGVGVTDHTMVGRMFVPTQTVRFISDTVRGFMRKGQPAGEQGPHSPMGPMGPAGPTPPPY